MDWKTLYCPNRSCRFYGLSWRQSALVKNGASDGQKQALCRACGRSVYLRHGTAYFELDADPAIFDTAVRALAEANGLRGTARIVQIDKDTASAWLERAAQHCRHLLLYLWHDLHVTECQLDELWSFVHTKEEHLPAAKLWCATYGDAWVSLAFAAVWRLVVAFVVGKRTQACANLLLERVKHVTSAAIPFFTSDQLTEYRTALLHVYGQWYQPARNGDRGRFPHQRRIAPPELLYAQVVKQRERAQIIAVTTKVVFGDPTLIAERLAASQASGVINTSFVERENLTLRHHNRRLTRKTIAFSKEVDWLERQLWLALAVLSFAAPTWEFATAAGRAGTYAWQRIGTSLVCNHASDGRRANGSYLEHHRIALIPRAGGLSGPVVRARTFVPFVQPYPSRKLRDTTS